VGEQILERICRSATMVGRADRRAKSRTRICENSGASGNRIVQRELASSSSMRAAARRDRFDIEGDAEECVARDRQLASTSRQPTHVVWTTLPSRQSSVAAPARGAGVDIAPIGGRDLVSLAAPIFYLS